MQDPEFNHRGLGTRGFGKGKQPRGQSVESYGEGGSLGVDQPLHDPATGPRSIGHEAGDAPLQLIGQPEIELIEAG
jgi:hypothetical protein